MAEKIIRDPVHDVIAFDLEDRAEGLIFRLLGCAEIQRLRRIRQLGLAGLAYPGADHSRYSHSLGVFETARRILRRIERQAEISPEERIRCYCAALLHDIGHGPFSHVFERVSGIHHEGLTRRLILDGDSEVHRTLIGFDPLLPEAVVGLLGCEGERDFICDVLSSQLDADRLDYLLRDNLMTGARYGRFDLNWLLQAMTLDPAGRRLAISWKGISAAEAYLQARYHMYRHVYFHKVVRSAEGMVKLALQRARQLLLAEKGEKGDGTDFLHSGSASSMPSSGNRYRPLFLPPGSGTVAKVLLNERMSAAEFRELDDVSVLGCFKAWAHSPDATLCRLCRGLLHRDLFKSIDLEHHENPAQAFRAAQEAVVKAGGDAIYSIFYDEPANAPYATGTQSILIARPDGTTRDFAEVSPFVQGLDTRLTFHRIHVDAPYLETAAEAAGF